VIEDFEDSISASQYFLGKSSLHVPHKFPYSEGQEAFDTPIP
jgi:hypothetical protein